MRAVTKVAQTAAWTVVLMVESMAGSTAEWKDSHWERLTADEKAVSTECRKAALTVSS